MGQIAAGVSFNQDALLVAASLNKSVDFSDEFRSIYALLPTSIGLKSDVLSSLANVLGLVTTGATGGSPGGTTLLNQYTLGQAGFVQRGDVDQTRIDADWLSGLINAIKSGSGTPAHMERLLKTTIAAKAGEDKELFTYAQNNAINVLTRYVFDAASRYTVNASGQLQAGSMDDESLIRYLYSLQNGSVRLDTSQMGALQGYAVGSNYIPNDGPAYLHAGEEVTPRPYVDLQREARDETNALLARLLKSNEEMRSELATLSRAGVASADSADRTATTLQAVTRGALTLKTEAA